MENVFHGQAKGVLHIMKFICNKSDLLTGVNIVLKAVPSKTTMTILECILIDTTSGGIKLMTNDMEIGIETYVAGSVEENGVIAADAKVFSEIVRRLPDNEVWIETDTSYKMYITCEKAKFVISCKSADEFPPFPVIERNDCVTLSQFTLREVIKQTIFSISDNDSNQMMKGILFDVNRSRLKVISLDGHRVSVRNIELRDEYQPKKAIVPGKTLNEVSKILSGETEDFVSIFFTNSHIVFEFGDTVVVSRIIEGEFFNIDHLMSISTDTKVSVNKKTFIESLDRSLLLIRENDKKPVVFQITDDEMKMKLSTGLGTMNEEIEVEKTGNDLTIAFNPKFMLDALRVIDDETVDMYMSTAKTPCFIKDVDDTYLYLILPVNFNSMSV